MLPLEYYQTDDVLHLSRDLLGKLLFTNIDGCITGGMIIETEAYRGPEDKASHAHALKRTARNEVMYNKGGCVYVYICYGIYPLLNIVTNLHDIPHAILIRAIHPLVGIDKMLTRRGMTKIERKLSMGPGTLSIALGVTKNLNGLLLTGPEIWLESRNVEFSDEEILTGPRIGIDYAGEDALLPWRFRLKESVYRNHHE